MPVNDKTSKTDRHPLTKEWLKKWRQDHLLQEKVNRKEKQPARQPSQICLHKPQLKEEQEAVWASESASSLSSISLSQLENLMLESVPSPTSAPSGSCLSSHPHLPVPASVPELAGVAFAATTTTSTSAAAAAASAAATTSAAATSAAATSFTTQIAKTTTTTTFTTTAAAADNEAHLAMLNVIEYCIESIEGWAGYAAAQPEDIDDFSPLPILDQPPQLDIQQTSDGVPVI
jgi:hypothetical protein